MPPRIMLVRRPRQPQPVLIESGNLTSSVFVVEQPVYDDDDDYDGYTSSSSSETDDDVLYARKRHCSHKKKKYVNIRVVPRPTRRRIYIDTRAPMPCRAMDVPIAH